MRRAPDAARPVIVRTLYDTRGSFVRTAHLLNASRRQLLRWVHQLELWDHVRAARRRFDWLLLHVGAMDELIEQIRELCAGMTVEEIEEKIRDSQNADRIKNPTALAQYFFDCCQDEETDDPADEEESDDEESDEPVPDESV